MSDDHSTLNWQAQADINVLRLRAALYEKIRDFFKQRQVLEVETPVLTSATTPDPNIHSFETHYESIGESEAQGGRYLSTSPEFHMKRLLASGSGSIYQLCHVFRQAESGNQHNPEFTMLEWYRVDFDYHTLMQEVAELVCQLIGKTIDIEFATYQSVFRKYLQIDPLASSEEELMQIVQNYGLVTTNQKPVDKDYYLDFLVSHEIQPKLGLNKLTFVHEYPASQCAYARLSPTNSQVAQRFELFYQGVELANGYQELLDAREQQHRFEQQNAKRKLTEQAPVNWDQNLVLALKQGMPACSGVALGVDRLIQSILNVKNIQDVLAFPFNRA